MVSLASVSFPTESFPIYVKCLNGTLIAMEYDPSKGKEGICAQLHRYDPEAFPLDTTVIVPMKEEALKEGDMVGVVVKEDTCSIQNKAHADAPLAQEPFGCPSFHTLFFVCFRVNERCVILFQHPETHLVTTDLFLTDNGSYFYPSCVVSVYKNRDYYAYTGTPLPEVNVRWFSQVEEALQEHSLFPLSPSARRQIAEMWRKANR